MADPIKLSTKPPFTALLGGDRVVIIRRAVDEPDPAKRVAGAPLQLLADAVTAATTVAARPVNYYGPGVPEVALNTLQSQLDWLFRRLAAVGSAAPANQAPTVNSFTTSPTSGAAGTLVTFTASASDPDGTVSYIYIYEASSPGQTGPIVATINGASGSVTLTPAAGSHQYYARAIDNVGLKSAEFATRFTVSITATSPTVSNPSFIGDDPAPTVSNPTFTAS